MGPVSRIDSASPWGGRQAPPGRGGEDILVRGGCAQTRRRRSEQMPGFTRRDEPLPKDSPTAELLRLNPWKAAAEVGVWLESMTDNWHAFTTLTFGKKWGPQGPNPERAAHYFRVWLSSLPPKARPLPCFVAVEDGTKNRRTHLHGLFGIPDMWREESNWKTAIWRSWFTRFGRAQVLPFIPALGATFYVAKYVTKEPLWWDVFPKGWKP